VETITEAELRELAAIHQPYCVSLYMPTHRKGYDTKQDPLRLKGLLNQAEESLLKQDMRAAEARAMLEPARQKISDSSFWSHQGDGLALLITLSEMRSYRLSRQLEEILFVGHRFLLTPLIPVAYDDAQFLTLVISPKRVRLMGGTRESIDEIKVEGLPKQFDELGKYIDTERMLQFHTRAAPTGAASSDRAAVFHGQGVGTDDALRKKRLLEFCRMIERSLQPVLANRKTPLVLAADQSLIPIYKETNTYPYILEEAISGNHDQSSEKQLHEATWPIVQEKLRSEKAQLLAIGESAVSDGRGSTELREILPAASDGRVDALMVTDACHVWGSYDSDAREASIHEQKQEGDDELMNLAAVTSLLKGEMIPE
jgi:hypothetical protein